MRRRRIGSKSTPIHIEQPKPSEAFDSETFDAISERAFQTAFADNYGKHKQFLLNLVASRLSIDSASTNVEKGINKSINGGVELRTSVFSSSVDQAYNTAIRLYAYEHVLAMVFPEPARRKDLLEQLLNVMISGAAKPPSNSFLQKLDKTIKEATANSDGPYSDQPNNRDGVVKRHKK